jgi:hypothetical protein
LGSLRLALNEAVAGPEPRQEVFDLVVENVLAAVGLHLEHGVPIVIAVAPHCDEGASRGQPAGISRRRLSSA